MLTTEQTQLFARARRTAPSSHKAAYLLCAELAASLLTEGNADQLPDYTLADIGRLCLERAADGYQPDVRDILAEALLTEAQLQSFDVEEDE